MRRAGRFVGLGAAALCAALAWGYPFTWDGGGTNVWTDCDDWQDNMYPYCWPQTTSDDATIPTSPTAWLVRLVTTQIDDLSIVQASVDFTAAGPGPHGGQLYIHATYPELRKIRFQGPANVIEIDGRVGRVLKVEAGFRQTAGVLADALPATGLRFPRG